MLPSWGGSQVHKDRGHVPAKTVMVGGCVCQLTVHLTSTWLIFLDLCGEGFKAFSAPGFTDEIKTPKQTCILG